MSLLDRIEAKLGRYAVQHLTLALMFGWILVFLLVRVMDNQELMQLLLFDPGLVLQGQWWRLFTFMLFPPTLHLLWFVIMASLYYTFGTAMEAHWGAFRYNLYILSGWALAVAAGFLGMAIAPYETVLSMTASFFVLEAIFLGFALLFPDYVINVFFVLPVKVKWLGLIAWGWLGYVVIRYPVTMKLLAAACACNVLLFFGGRLWRQIRRRGRDAAAAVEHKRTAGTPFNTCHVCGITDLKDPDRIFRVDTSADGSPDICLPCLDARRQAADTEV